ncbi:TPA: PAS domain S-box protein, partial [Pseudomonas aeruginosa]|nr:PAS domain S-box protein [Pseudomonas aeruginosa]
MEFAGRAGVFRKVGQVPGASQRAAGRRSSYYLAGCALQPGSSSRRVNTSMKTTRKPKVPLNQATRNRLLDEAVDDYAIHTLDSAGRIASWSAGAARLFGHDASEILGCDYACFHTRKDRDAGVPQQALRQADAEGRFETEGWRVRSNGKRFWAQVVIDAIRDSQGQLLGFAQLIHDLSEGRAAKEALRRSQEQFRLLVQSVTDYAIYMLDHRGRITNWNLGAQRIKGYLPEEVIGRHFSCFYTPEDREAGEPARGLAAAEREGRFEKEGWRVRKDGSRFWANVVIDPIRDSDGRLIGFAKVTRDITHRIEAERELERARQELFQAQKMESLGHLTGGVAHDFNNLLTVIIGSLGLLKKRLPGDQRTADLLQNALEAAQRGANLTQRMLSFARKQRLDPQPCAIPDLLRGMTDLLIHSLGPSVSIETRFPLDLDLGLTDANQLELSIINLATNARDAMPNGGRIVFSASNQRGPADNPHRLAPGNYICLSISDTGSGMDEETLR